jgi:hypothetical protein
MDQSLPQPIRQQLLGHSVKWENTVVSAPLSTGVATTNPYYSSGAGYSLSANALGPALTITAPVFVGIPTASDAPSDAPFASAPTSVQASQLGAHDRKHRQVADDLGTMFREGHGGVYREGLYRDKARWVAVLYVPPGGIRDDVDDEGGGEGDGNGGGSSSSSASASDSSSASASASASASSSSDSSSASASSSGSGSGSSSGKSAAEASPSGGGTEWAGEGRHHYLGRFETEEQASSAYNWAMEEVRLTGTFTGRRKRPGLGITDNSSSSSSGGGGNMMTSSNSTGYLPVGGGLPYGVNLGAPGPGAGPGLPKAGSGYFP